MHTITKEFHFSSSHILHGLEEGHPCGRLHGHNYLLKVELQGNPNDDGFVLDYRKLDPIKQFVDNELDHRHLNDVFIKLTGDKLFQPSAENMSKYLFEMFKPAFPSLSAIELSETPKTNCRYEPTNPFS